MPQVLPTPPEREEPEHPGFQIVRWLKPFGSGLVLLIFILFLVYAFSTGREPIKGYTPPHDMEYYAEHPDALEDELNTISLDLLQDGKLRYSHLLNGEETIVYFSPAEYPE